MANIVYNVLFLCTGNSARSIMAEVILNKEGKGLFRAFSAGSHPAGSVNPHATRLLGELGFDLSGLRSKSWDEFAGAGAPEMDFIFTVCDDAAGEVCPIWPGHPATAHWGIPDPAKTTGTPAEVQLAFADAYRLLSNRIGVFVNLPIAKLDRAALHHHLREIGEMDRTPSRASAVS
jgi:protein-tyrosine-phosphatase